MGGSSFELIMQEVLGQKQYMDDLIAENRELRKQLANLRAGQGIFVEICGQYFALDGAQLAASPQLVTPTLQDSSISFQPTTEMPVSVPAMNVIPETPVPGTDEAEAIEYFLDQTLQEEADAQPTSTFLEDMLIEEFASASTTPMEVRRSSQTRKLQAIDEDEHAELRKELIGSFLLE